MVFRFLYRDIFSSKKSTKKRDKMIILTCSSKSHNIKRKRAKEEKEIEMQKKILYLNKPETQTLYEVIYKDKSNKRRRNIAIFELTKYCALRASEVSMMKLDDYDRDNELIFCQRLKGSNSNMLKIVDKHVLCALEDYICEREYYEIKSPYMFPSQKGTPISRQRLDALMKHYCSLAGNISGDKMHMHVLRHTRAIELAEAGFDVDDIQFWLGHKNPSNTFKYLSYTASLKNRMFRTLESIEEGQYKSRYRSTEIYK